MRQGLNHFLLLLMLAMPLALAQHASVHFSEGAHRPAHQQEDHGSDSARDEICQLCLLSKALSHGLVQSGPDVLIPDVSEFLTSLPYTLVLARQCPSSYSARAPPSFSA